MDAWRSRLPEGQHRRHRQLRPGRLRCRRREVQRRRRRLRRLRLRPRRRRRASSTRPRSAAAADAIEVPDYVSPIAVVFNVEGVDDAATLAPKTIAEIFDGKITKWNDAAIAADNPDAKLPVDHDHAGAPLRRVGHHEELHRLPRARPATAPGPTRPTRSGRSRAVRAPRAPPAWSPRSAGGKGTIGYADVSQAGDLRRRRRSRSATAYVAPSAEGAAKAVEASPLAEGRPDERHGRQDRPHERPRPGAYPLMLASYLIACPTYDDAKTRPTLVKGFLTYVVSRRGPAGGAPTRPARLRSRPRSPQQAAKIVDTDLRRSG